MSAPLYMYFIVFAKLFILGLALIGGVPLLERRVEKQEEEMGGVTRIVKKGSWRYVEYVGTDHHEPTNQPIHVDQQPAQTFARQLPKVEYH
ncbi:hypothetical protein [Alicyclobacillus acidiphilus]|uniref:hypothetical protein n=1 Tax=Alicyclobacillus acidiphilus TaxID=182455 RepID=UPI00082A31C6|nr:hypothetical protein [Alicyclobacillus acidiphilus]